MPKKPKLVDRPKKPSVPRPQYGQRHRDLRKIVLAQHPICQQCNNAFSQEAHHLRYPALSPDDYLAVCIKCHHEIEREKRHG
jgi:hypothetical protein